MDERQGPGARSLASSLRLYLEVREAGHEEVRVLLRQRRHRQEQLRQQALEGETDGRMDGWMWHVLWVSGSPSLRFFLENGPVCP